VSGLVEAVVSKCTTVLHRPPPSHVESASGPTSSGQDSEPPPSRAASSISPQPYGDVSCIKRPKPEHLKPCWNITQRQASSSGKSSERRQARHIYASFVAERANLSGLKE
jgi:hypothetical protein